MLGLKCKTSRVRFATVGLSETFSRWEVRVSRRFLMCGLLLLAIALTATAADDFWATKDWKLWTRAECEKMLSDSPWAKTWRAPAIAQTIVFVVQVRSALPIREALVRKQQLDQKYDTMDEDKRKVFDGQAEEILSRKYDHMILINVDYSRADVDDATLLNIGIMFGSVHNGATGLNLRLITETGDRVEALRVDSRYARNYQYDLIFPRVKDGATVIKEGAKFFDIQFQSPSPAAPSSFGTPPSPNYLVNVKFEISKMLVDGKPSF